MPGNEEQLIRFLIEELEEGREVNLPIIGNLKNISNPSSNKKREEIKNKSDLAYLSSNDKHKKADTYLNDFGISIKEETSSVLYNKLQRRHLPELLDFLFKKEIKAKSVLADLDREINKVNNGAKRDIPWNNIFSVEDFRIILQFLMMEGNADTVISDHPAKYILAAPKEINQESLKEIKVYDFENYFEENQNKIVIAARRCWIGQKSKSESRRAQNIIKFQENHPWVFKNISGQPREWDPLVPSNERREAFYINIIQNG